MTRPVDTTPSHTSVLMDEVLNALSISSGDTVVDATLGGAGHFSKLLLALGEAGTLIGIDADADAIARTKEVVRADARAARPAVHLVEDNFKNLESIAKKLEVSAIDKALFDLGWSSFHLSSGRGFSFQSDEPLYMTYGDPAKAERTAADIVNSTPEQELADLIYEYGEETFSRQIAKAIVEHRRKERITTTSALVRAIEAGTPSWYHKRRIHPATKTFQALRIAVNDEMGAIREGLASALTLLSPGGRVAVITFHSIEDRVVKSFFRDAAEQGTGTLLFKKPVAPGVEELRTNPRARSAKLRVFVKAASLSSPFEGVAAHLTHTYAN